MALLEIVQTHYVSTSVRLEETTATQVDQYAAFLHATADEVIDKALTYVFAKDREFQQFLKSPQSRQVPSTLRVRKAVASDVPEQPASRPNGGVEPTEILRGARA
ncbi:MAG TPA: hypothetical protein VGI45_31930 [Terracidiphilus sp.]|jgi:hypothetical protein